MHLSTFSPEGGGGCGITPRELEIFEKLWSNSLPMSQKFLGEVIYCWSNPQGILAAPTLEENIDRCIWFIAGLIPRVSSLHPLWRKTLTGASGLLLV